MITQTFVIFEFLSSRSTATAAGAFTSAVVDLTVLLRLNTFFCSRPTYLVSTAVVVALCILLPPALSTGVGRPSTFVTRVADHPGRNDTTLSSDGGFLVPRPIHSLLLEFCALLLMILPSFREFSRLALGSNHYISLTDLHVWFYRAVCCRGLPDNEDHPPKLLQLSSPS